MTHHFDVSLCMKENEMKHYIFTVPKNIIDSIDGQREKFRYAAQESLAFAANVSPLRINRLVVSFFI